MLSDVTAVDLLPRAPRFEVVYHLYSVARNHRVRVKAPVPEDDPELHSVEALYASANWMEREVWDMYGIRFAGHPDLRRLLLYEEFEGHPLRKDYAKEKRQPLVGPQN
jgi:NADH-quinone oxidoreductase subunit C